MPKALDYLEEAVKLAGSTGTRRDAILYLVKEAYQHRNELRMLRAELDLLKKPKAKPKRKGR